MRSFYLVLRSCYSCSFGGGFSDCQLMNGDINDSWRFGLGEYSRPFSEANRHAGPCGGAFSCFFQQSRPFVIAAWEMQLAVSTPQP